MFNLQGSELVIILLLALVVLGPEKLPDAMRKAGHFFAELKKMSAGFQSEFRAAVDEPMREIRDTANVLRDSADFTKLQEGEREEKPKTAEMSPADPADRPSDEIPTFEPSPSTDGPSDEVAGVASPSETEDAEAESSTGSERGPSPSAGSRPAPFSGNSSAAPRPRPTAPEAAPATTDPVAAPAVRADPAAADPFGAVPGPIEPATDVDEQPPA